MPTVESRLARSISACALIAVIATSACSGAPRDAAEPPSPQPLPQLPDDSLAERGRVIDTEAFVDVDASITELGATATRVVYRSTSGLDGLPTAVSGVVFTPAGDAEPGSRPVVTFGHGTTGVTADCAPSSFPDLLGYASTIVPLMKLGYVAVMTDYQGLGYQGPGSSPVHPYLDPDTSAYNMIDAVRAARQVTRTASDKWAAMGVSQGGQASWSTVELADFYAPELNFVGSVALAPAADLTDQARLASSRFMTREQQVDFPYLIAGLRTADADARTSDYLHGILAEDPPLWTSCVADRAALAERSARVQFINPRDTVPIDDEAARRLTRWLESIRLPKRTAVGPLLVVNGDQDNVVKPQWVERAVESACDLGYSVDHIVRAGQGHDNLDPGAETAIWFEARFRGDPPTDDACS